jgi:hypothetical protein
MGAFFGPARLLCVPADGKVKTSSGYSVQRQWCSRVQALDFSERCRVQVLCNAITVTCLITSTYIWQLNRFNLPPERAEIGLILSAVDRKRIHVVGSNAPREALL